MKSVSIGMAIGISLLLLTEFSYGQQHKGRSISEGAYILIQVNTYRIGTSQTAEATVSVRRPSHPNVKIGAEVMTCQITKPVEGEKKNGRRVMEQRCTATWPIDSDSDEAMKDFEVTATASSQGIGDISATEVFKYKELHSLTSHTPEKITSKGTGPVSSAKSEPGFIVLLDGSIHRNSTDKEPVDQYYVTGRVLTNGKFQPDTNATVLGKGKDCPNLSQGPGYRLLESGHFMGAQAGQAIAEPYVYGCRRENDFFPKAPPTVEKPQR